MYKFESGNLTQLWGEELSETIPRAVVFIKKVETLVAFGMESGTVVHKDAETAAQKSTCVFSSSIRSVGVCPTTGNYIIDNMKTGFDLYTPNRTAPARSFDQGVFAEKGKVAVCGSDHGNVYVFGVTSTEPQQILKHGRKEEMIQTVKAAITGEKHIIATASSGRKFEIKVWEKGIRSGSTSRERQETISFMTVLNVLLFVVLCWMTAGTWLPPVADVHEKINFVAIQVSHMLNLHTNGQPAILDDVKKVITRMDEDMLRKVLQIK
ncbi:unnamed protein product [Cyclocybe aegerita]|uniref:Uncharacterized protein n=1 Tax=Cyclocybe aegerita TaxID=1973307 RepID=A0A8S0XSL5_CYCAE|nr:unnamed protein product [Cyclocybe aegerita]